MMHRIVQRGWGSCGLAGVAAWLVCLTIATASPVIAQQAVAAEDRNAHPDRRAAQAFTRPVTVDLERVSLKAAMKAVAGSAGVRIQYQNEQLDAMGTPVTVHATRMPLGEVLDRILAGTALTYVALNTDLVVVKAKGGVVQQGIVAGKVLDERTKQPLRGAKVALDGVDRAVTGEDGVYRVTGIDAGMHRVAVKLLGYAKSERTVTVPDGIAVTVDVMLEPSTNMLDQIVVTGTVIPTELKAVPSAITVITAKDIEQRGITKIDQLFRGDVPGLFVQNQGAKAFLDEVTMFSRGTTALSPSSVGNDPELTNPIKTYVDGVELADPKYLSQIDPKSIERIEILTGPQASTIYGSNAINGVMQIFTKRGTTSKPQLTLNLLSGFVQNNFSSALAPQHDYNGSLSGIEGHLSYNAGGSWNYTGRWAPAKQLARTSGFGGARLDLPTPAGRVTADMTLRHTLTRSLQHGGNYQTETGYRETGWYTNVSDVGLDRPTAYTLTGETHGLTLSYAPAAWWSHEIGLGSDVSDTEQRLLARGYIGVYDTTLYLAQSHTDRRSLRYTTTARIPVTSLAQLTVTAGTDSWQNLTSSLAVSPKTLTGSLTNVLSVSRQPSHNTGGFLQSQLGLRDKLFFTYGFRAEWNPNYGAEAEPNIAPRYGVAYTQELGLLTAKVRGAYGRSTRPPVSTLKVGQTIADYWGSSWSFASPYFLPYYGGMFDYRLANPELGPEDQQGGEGGLELYFGTRGSLVVTRYNQTVDGLIAQPIADSVRTVVPCSSSGCFAGFNYTSLDAAGYGYYPQRQNLNIGSIRNQGWELQSSMHVGSLTTHGTYSWTKSRTIGINPRYRASFPATSYPQYQPGATFQYLPEHTWALGVTYARAASSIGLNITGTGRVTNLQDDFYQQNLSGNIRLPQNQLNVSNTGRYISFNAPYALTDLTASHRFTSTLEALLQVQNLSDRYTNDYNAVLATIGRQVKLGVRVR